MYFTEECEGCCRLTSDISRYDVQAQHGDALYLRVFTERLRVHVGRRVLKDRHCMFRVDQIFRQGKSNLSVSYLHNKQQQHIALINSL